MSVFCDGSALDRTRSRVVSYEDQVTVLREQLSDIYMQEEDWAKAAQLLAEIDLDSGAPQSRDCRCRCIHAQIIHLSSLVSVAT